MKQVVIFKENNKMFMSEKNNYNMYVLNKNRCIELTGFDNLDECAEYLIDNFGYVVFKID